MSIDLKFPIRAGGARFVGLAADNQFIVSTSAARTLMAYKQRDQTQELINPGISSIQSGLEMNIHQHTLKVTIPTDAEILQIIPISANNAWRTTVFYRCMSTNLLGHIELKNYYSGDGKHGFKYIKTDAYNTRLAEKAFMEEGTPLLEAPSSMYEDEYNYGLELNTLVASTPEGAEDGITVSESAIEKMAFTETHLRQISIPRNHEAIVIMEHEHRKLVVPEPGMKVRDDGIIMAVRNIGDPIGHILSHNHHLQRLNYDTDTIHQIHGNGGEVLDIWVIKSGPVSHDPYTEQLDLLANTCINYQDDILKAYRRLRHMVSGLTPETDAMITGLILTAEKARQKKEALTLNMNKSPLPQYYIEITVGKTSYPDMAAKLSDKVSAKSVIVKIEKEENMPVDQYGRRAEIVVSREAGTNRNIVGRDHAFTVVDCISTATEMLLNLCGLTKLFMTDNEAIHFVTRLPQEKVNELLCLLKELYTLINKEQARQLDAYWSDRAEMNLLLADCLRRGIVVALPLDVVCAGNQRDSDHSLPIGPLGITEPLLASRFNRPATPVTYRLFNGDVITTEHSMKIAPIYYAVLDKTGQTFNVAYTTYRQVRGLTAHPNKRHKQVSNVSYASAKQVGNDEAIVLGGVIGSATMAKYIRDLSDPKYNAYSIVTALRTGEVYPDIPTDVVPVGQNPGLLLIKHVFMAMGVDLSYSPRQ
jgi:hypothetical protein